MRERCDRFVNANNVSPQVDLKVTGSSEGSYSGCDYFLNALRPSSKKLVMPSILNILMRSGMLSSIQANNASKAMADIYIHPPVELYEFLDLGPAHEIEAVGHQYVYNTIKKHLHDNESLKKALVN